MTIAFIKGYERVEAFWLENYPSGAMRLAVYFNFYSVNLLLTGASSAAWSSMVTFGAILYFSSLNIALSDTSTRRRSRHRFCGWIWNQNTIRYSSRWRFFHREEDFWKVACTWRWMLLLLLLLDTTSLISLLFCPPRVIPAGFFSIPSPVVWNITLRKGEKVSTVSDNTL